MKIHHFHRLPSPEQFSVERYFETVRSAISSDLEIVKVDMPFRSRGLFRRVANILYAMLHQGTINHVTGDVNYIALLMRRRSTVLSILDCQILERLTGWKRGLVRWLWFDLPTQRVNLVTVISEATKTTLLKHVSVDPDRVRVIPVSVSPGFRPSPKALNANNPRILQIGTKANKNIPRLILAIKEIRCTLEVIGPINEELRQLLVDNDIDYQNKTGLTDAEIVERYEACDLVAFVSTHEGFGMPIVEAQCVERPVVTSNCSSMPEVAGDGACFVDPLDVDSIRNGFQRVINDSEYREGLIAAGRKNCKRFEAEKIAKQFRDLYFEIAETP